MAGQTTVRPCIFSQSQVGMSKLGIYPMFNVTFSSSRGAKSKELSGPIQHEPQSIIFKCERPQLRRSQVIYHPVNNCNLGKDEMVLIYCYDTR